MLGYFRTMLKPAYLHKETDNKAIVVMKPRDLDYEIKVFEKYRDFISYLLSIKEQRTSLD